MEEEQAERQRWNQREQDKIRRSITGHHYTCIYVQYLHIIHSHGEGFLVEWSFVM